MGDFKKIGAMWIAVVNSNKGIDSIVRNIKALPYVVNVDDLCSPDKRVFKINTDLGQMALVEDEDGIELRVFSLSMIDFGRKVLEKISTI